MGKTAYETDFHAWTRDQAALLKAGRLSELDRMDQEVVSS